MLLESYKKNSKVFHHKDFELQLSTWVTERIMCLVPCFMHSPYSTPCLKSRPCSLPHLPACHKMSIKGGGQGCPVSNMLFANGNLGVQFSERFLEQGFLHVFLIQLLGLNQPK